MDENIEKEVVEQEVVNPTEEPVPAEFEEENKEVEVEETPVEADEVEQEEES